MEFGAKSKAKGKKTTKKDIELVVLDADRTMWRIENTRVPGKRMWLTQCSGKPKKISDIEVEYDDCRVILAVDLRETLQILKDKGVLLSVASRNKKKILDEALKKFGIFNMFYDVQAGHNTKGGMIRKTLDGMRNKNICIPNKKILFIDDDNDNLSEVRDKHKGITTLNVHKIKTFNEVLDYVKGI